MESAGLSGLLRAVWSRKDLREGLGALCKEFAVPVPFLAFEPMSDCAGKCETVKLVGYSRITLSTALPAGRSPLVLVHEVAHHVLDFWDVEYKLAPHGPEFLGIYGDALAACGLVPYEGFRALARQYRVDILDTSLATTATKLRKLIKKRAAEAALSPHPRKGFYTST